MAYTVTSRKSYGSRLLNSVFGVLIGIALIVGMSVMLFWNEGRYNPADLAKEAQEITLSNTSSLEGQLVYYNCTLTGTAMTYDTIVSDSNYLYLNKKVEVYAWIETSETETHDNYGGSETTETTYYYNLGWTDSPQNPSTFADSAERTKPLAVAAETANSWENSAIDAGDFGIDQDALFDGPFVLNNDENLHLVSGETVKTSYLNDDRILSGDYVYIKASGSGGPTTPAFNDTRVSYTCVPSGISGILLGKASNGDIISFSNEDTTLYRFLPVDTLDAAVTFLDEEHNSSLWMLRIIGTIVMCLGFALLTKPLSTLLMVLPFLGHASEFILGIASFLVGFLFSVLVILISMIIHNIIALIIALAVLILIVIWGAKKAKKRAAEGEKKKKKKK